ncbi:MAG: RHS repeat-associated core domain-containing protein [Bacteroidales bacterium]|nr:RHS repeat-associated core domain-containing protein [Bacteroidales bacterium]
MQASINISSQQNVAFGNTENGCLWYLQSIDNQRLNFYQTLSYSTGKEKDCETGYYAFGARYYDCDLSGLFLSVDPMADKYPSLSPYAYCAWNPVKLVDPDGRDVEIIKDDENRTVTIKANFYYNYNQLGSEAEVFLEGFKNVLTSWQNDIETALMDESLGVSGYKVNFKFDFFECENPIKSADNDRIGNSLSDDPDFHGPSAMVSNTKHLTANLRKHSRGNNPNAYDPLFYSTTEYQGTLKHEVGHFFGLYDRYKEAKQHAPNIPNDLMDKTITTRNNAVEPFKRVWQSAGLENRGTKSTLINMLNREVF